VRQELYHRWRSEGEKLLLKIEKGVDPSTFSEEQLLYLDLATRILTAEAQVEDTLATSWQGAALDDWKAAKEFLARRFPNTWGRDPNLLTEEGEVRLGVLHVSIARRPSEPAPEA
jgi:predicted phage-related endonuclease